MFTYFMIRITKYMINCITSKYYKEIFYTTSIQL